MHVDPAGPEDSSSLKSLGVPSSPRGRGASKVEDEQAAAPRRDGLPKAFRMRHGKHYVEQLMGDGPLKTVRDLALADFHEPPLGSDDLSSLQESIKDVGVLQPLVVALDSGRYRIIAGVNRFRAAAAAGLTTVPCVVHEPHGHSIDSLRTAATERGAMPNPPTPRVADPAPAVAPERPAPVEQRALAALDAAVDEPLRLAVLTDLLTVERQRAETMAAADAVLAPDARVDRGEIAAGLLIQGAISRIRTEARLRNVVTDVSVQNVDYRVPGDARLLALAVECMMRSLLSLCRDSAARLRVVVEGTDLRPALIVRLSQDATSLDGQAAARFFEQGFEGHPGGTTAALMAAGVRRIARMHGGRADLQVHTPRGCTMTMVVPRFARH